MENKAKRSRDLDFLRILDGDFSKKMDGFEKPVGEITEPEAYKTEEDPGHQRGTSHKPHAKEASRLGENICESNKLKYSKTKPKSARQRRQVNDAFEKKAARVSVSKNGVAFSITWRNSKHLYYYLTIPKEVATSMNLSNQEKVVLKDQENNRWLIELRVRPSRVDLAQGWRKFLYDKKITVGDILTFEFHSNNLIHVNVECSTQADHPSHSATQCPSGFIDMLQFKHVEPSVNYDGKHQTPEVSQNYENLCSKFRRSSFKIIWRETTHGKFLIIPKSVAEEQKLVNNQSILLSGEGGKLWHMAVKMNPIIGCFLVSRGWSEFWQGNGIAEGDTLNFEFISVGMVKVSIARASLTHDHTVRCNSGNSFAFDT